VADHFANLGTLLVALHLLLVVADATVTTVRKRSSFRVPPAQLVRASAAAAGVVGEAIDRMGHSF
jgi:hypothetical protein